MVFMHVILISLMEVIFFQPKKQDSLPQSHRRSEDLGSEDWRFRMKGVLVQLPVSLKFSSLFNKFSCVFSLSFCVGLSGKKRMEQATCIHGQ
jgi:hypothetical protein